MTELTKQTLKINGVDTVVYAGGTGEPLHFLHGAGTFHGFEFAKAWADSFHVIHPYHPGFGESGDDPKMDTFHDYVMHYVELLDALGLDSVHLVGFSLGGHLAAQFASQHRGRVKTLTLVAPPGMKSAEHPTADVLALPGEQLVAMLAGDAAAVESTRSPVLNSRKADRQANLPGVFSKSASPALESVRH